MTAVPLSILIEASECLRQARETASGNLWVRLLTAQSDLDVYIKVAMSTQTIEVKP